MLSVDVIVLLNKLNDKILDAKLITYTKIFCDSSI